MVKTMLQMMGKVEMILAVALIVFTIGVVIKRKTKQRAPKVNSAIWQKEQKDCWNSYNDVTLVENPGQRVIVYYGQNSGRNDRHIQPDRTLYLTRIKDSDPYTYIGKVISKQETGLTNASGAKQYIIAIDTTYVHNIINPGTIINRTNVHSGPGCIKKECATVLGFPNFRAWQQGITRLN